MTPLFIKLHTYHLDEMIWVNPAHIVLLGRRKLEGRVVTFLRMSDAEMADDNILVIEMPDEILTLIIQAKHNA